MLDINDKQMEYPAFDLESQCSVTSPQYSCTPLHQGSAMLSGCRNEYNCNEQMPNIIAKQK